MEFINFGWLSSAASEALIHALGWTVFHSIWQGLAILSLYLVAGGMLRERRPEMRYWLANIGLYAVLIAAMITFARYHERGTQLPLGADNLSLKISLPEVEPTEAEYSMGYFEEFQQYFERHMHSIVGIWLLGLVLYSVRFFSGLGYICYLSYRPQRRLGKFWHDKVRCMQGVLGIKKITSVAESLAIQVPIIIGYFRPVILLPVGTINQLSAKEVEAIIAHELAHLKRNDYLFNLIQSAIEVLFYFNPAVWLLARYIRKERENCCDDIAVRLSGDPVLYARALVKIQENLLDTKGTPTMAMSLLSEKNHLLRRIRRILNQPDNNSYAMEKFGITLLLLAAIILFSLKATGDKGENAVLISSTAELEEMLDSKAMHVSDQSGLTRSGESSEIAPDTLPSGKVNIAVDRNGKKIKARIEDRKIVELNIDGKQIPQEELADYESYIEEILEDVPSPPTPPTPPTPGSPTAPPVPAVPPVPKAPKAPPAPKLADGYDSFEFGLKDDSLFRELTDIQEELERVQRMLQEKMVKIGSAFETNSDEILAAQRKYLAEMEANLGSEVKESERLELIMEKMEKEMALMAEKQAELAESLVQSEQLMVQEKLVTLQEKLNRWQEEQAVLVKTILESLVRDGLIEQGANYDVLITNEEMRIDGQLQPSEVHRKYLNLIEEKTKKPLKGDFRIKND